MQKIHPYDKTEDWTLLEETATDFACKEVPNIQILCERDYGKFVRLVLTTVTNYFFNFNSNKNEFNITFETATINPIVLNEITHNKFSSYRLYTQEIFRRMTDGKDYYCNFDSWTFTNLSISYKTFANGDPGRWRFTLSNQ